MLVLLLIIPVRLIEYDGSGSRRDFLYWLSQVRLLLLMRVVLLIGGSLPTFSLLRTLSYWCLDG